MKFLLLLLLFLSSGAHLLMGRSLRGTSLGETLRARAKSNRRAMVKSQVERVLRLGPSSKLPSGSGFLSPGLVKGLSVSSSSASSGEHLLRLGLSPALSDYTEKLQSSFPLCQGRRQGRNWGESLEFEIWPGGQKILRGKLNLFVAEGAPKDLRINVFWNLNEDGSQLRPLDTKNISGLSGSWITLDVLPAVASWYESPTGNYGLTLEVTDGQGRKVPLRDVIVPMNCSDTRSLPFPVVLRSSSGVSLYPLLDILTVEPPPPPSVSPSHPLMHFPILGAAPNPGSSDTLLQKIEDVSFMSEDPNLLLLPHSSSSASSSASSTPPFKPVAKKIIRNRSELLAALSSLGIEDEEGSPELKEALLRRLSF